MKFLCSKSVVVSGCVYILILEVWCVVLIYKFIFEREMRTVQQRDIENCLSTPRARVVLLLPAYRGHCHH